MTGFDFDSFMLGYSLTTFIAIAVVIWREINDRS